MINHLCGTFLIQAKNAFLNGAGSIKEGKSDVTVPKFFIKNDVEIPYISAQCWRRWWRENFIKELDNNFPLATDEKKLEKEPFVNASQDIFGYFEGIKNKIPFQEINQKNVSQIRNSPLQVSQLHPLQKFGTEWRERSLTKDEGYVHLKEGTPLPYSTKFYSADLQCIFSLDIDRIGKFRNFNDRQELLETTSEKLINAGLLVKVNSDEYKLKNRPSIRKNRILYTFKSLMTIHGGAKKPQYGCDISPKLLILAGQNGANPILSQCVEMGMTRPIINLNKLEKILEDFPDLFKTPIYIGMRNNYLEFEDGEEAFQKKVTQIETKTGITIKITSPMGVLSELEQEEF